MATRPPMVLGADGLPQQLQAGDTLSSTLGVSSIAALTGINTTETYITPATFAIPANTLAVGDTFYILAFGRNTSSASGTNNFRPRLGSTGTISDTQLAQFTSNNASSGTNIPFMIEYWVVVRAIGASGSVFAYGRIANSGTVGIAQTGMALITGGSTTINTTQNLILGASLVSSATTSTSVIEHAMVKRL